MSNSTIYDSMNGQYTYVDPNSIPPNARPNAGKGANMDKEAFLKLLMAQIKYQDPLEPMDNSESMAQMAQFSTLEQLMGMGDLMGSFFNYQMANSVIQYSNLIGQEVSYTMPVEGEVGEDGKPKIEEGKSKVVGVRYENGTVILSLENGKQVEVGYVSSIGNVPEATKPDKPDETDPDAKPDDTTPETKPEDTDPDTKPDEPNPAPKPEVTNPASTGTNALPNNAGGIGSKL